MGKWLQQAGFEPRSRVCVQVEDGRLIITPVSTASPATAGFALVTFP
ncbi:SymE family type I addiction module toxin [Caballeronia sp. GAWG2-1]